jgi:tRNA threonylcarbamoyladenosine biosynthesis protein TsaE
MAQKLQGGDCIELVSDLGGGKTTFTRGLVRGLGSTDTVSSPTFTIGKQYKAGDMNVYHYDFYRLQDPGLVAEELAEALEDKKGVIVVEWAESVAHVLPVNRIIIMIDRVSDNADVRKCTIKYGVGYAELMKKVAL